MTVDFLFFQVKLTVCNEGIYLLRIELTSLQNPTVKRTYKLRDRRGREKSGLTLLEGYREISRAAEYGMELVECFYCPEMFLGENEDSLLDQLEASGVKLYDCARHVLLKLTYRDRPEGLIATAKIRSHKLSDIEFRENGLYLVAEDIEKPGNHHQQGGFPGSGRAKQRKKLALLDIQRNTVHGPKCPEHLGDVADLQTASVGRITHRRHAGSVCCGRPAATRSARPCVQ